MELVESGNSLVRNSDEVYTVRVFVVRHVRGNGRLLKYRSTD